MEHPKNEFLEQLLTRHGHTRCRLEKLAMTLTAGKGWYGTPVADRTHMLTDFANCLLTGRLWWALEPAAFGFTRPDKDEEKDDIWRENNSDDQRILDDARIPPAEDKSNIERWKWKSFLDAAATACIGRYLFYTVSAMREVGPRDMRSGDKVCVIYGTPVPFIIRPCEEKRGYTLVGECCIDDIMHGEATDDESYETWIDLV